MMSNCPVGNLFDSPSYEKKFAQSTTVAACPSTTEIGGPVKRAEHPCLQSVGSSADSSLSLHCTCSGEEQSNQQQMQLQPSRKRQRSKRRIVMLSFPSSSSSSLASLPLVAAMRSVLTTLLLALCIVQQQLSSFGMCGGEGGGMASANWIDKDTPLEALTAMPYNVKPPPPYKPPPKKEKKHHHKHKTISPAPTVSHAPSEAPSEQPSAYPTFAPRSFDLVFSDEFNTPYRTFEDGSDPRWTALEKNDYTNDALHYYSTKNARTDKDGYLVITSEATDTEIIGFDDVKRKRTRVTKHFKSAMLQSWNKFCFTGGIVEAEVMLPGKHDIGGLWPAFWLLGNLARHTYVGSSEHIWPWSSVECTTKSGWAQKISGCQSVAHYGMASHYGRGAPEMDIFEVQPGGLKANTGVFLKTSVGQPFMSSSFQVAPGRPGNRPGPGEWPGPGQWYEGLIGGKNTSLNILFYGNYNHFLSDVNAAREDYWSDAISFNRQLTADYFSKPHVYRLEWDVPSEEKDGYLHWFLDGELVLAINGSGVKAAGLGSEVSSEPSYILLNTAISKQWGFPLKCPNNCPCIEYDCQSEEWSNLCGFSEGFCTMMKNETPPQYKINWVRVYQDPNDPSQKVGCSTPERPTRKWIEAHEELYKQATDVHPLKGLQTGNGECDPSATGIFPEACGGPEHGRCTPGKVCECMPGFTGPHCLSQEGRDPILYDQPDTIADVGFIPPRVLPKFLASALLGLICLLMLAAQMKNRIEGWRPVPDSETRKHLNKKTSFYQEVF